MGSGVQITSDGAANLNSDAEILSYAVDILSFTAKTLSSSAERVSWYLLISCVLLPRSSILLIQLLRSSVEIFSSGSDAEMLSYGAEIMRSAAEVLSSGGEVLSSDLGSLSSGTEKIDIMVTVHRHSKREKPSLTPPIYP